MTVFSNARNLNFYTEHTLGAKLLVCFNSLVHCIPAPPPLFPLAASPTAPRAHTAL